jgi:hypothetical protein
MTLQTQLHLTLIASLVFFYAITKTCQGFVIQNPSSQTLTTTTTTTTTTTRQNQQDSSSPQQHSNRHPITPRIYSTSSSSNIDELSLTVDNIPSEFEPLFRQAALTTALSRKPVTDEQAHGRSMYINRIILS